MRAALVDAAGNDDGPLTREALREELRRFADDELQAICQGLVASVRRDTMEALDQGRAAQPVPAHHSSLAVPCPVGKCVSLGSEQRRQAWDRCPPTRPPTIQDFCGSGMEEEQGVSLDDEDFRVLFKHPIRSHTTAKELCDRAVSKKPAAAPTGIRGHQVTSESIPDFSHPEMHDEHPFESPTDHESESVPEAPNTMTFHRIISDTPSSQPSVTPSPSPSLPKKPMFEDATCDAQGVPNGRQRRRRSSIGKPLPSPSLFATHGRTSTVKSVAAEVVRDTVAIRMVEHHFFDAGVGAAILLNAILIGAQTEVGSQRLGREQDGVFRAFEYVFCVVFVAELGLRLFAYRWNFLFSAARCWNLLDALLVGLQLLEFGITATLGRADNAGGFTALRILRILRVIKIVRLVRVLRLIGELRTIVICITSSLRSLSWTVALLLLMIYITAVYLTQTVSDYRAMKAGEGDPALDMYYGSLFRSVLTLYQSVAGGISWDVAVMPLIAEIHPALGVLFCLYIAFVTLAIMNVVTGVFVQTAMETAQRDRDIYMVHHVRSMFAKADRDGNGRIHWQDFEAQFHSPEMQDTLKLMDLDATAAKALFTMLDVDEVGEVNFDDFVELCVRLRGPPRSVDLMTSVYEHRRFAMRLYKRMKVIQRSLQMQ
mmetsp:Transcript_53609/g.155834  ORF Transcript_53609/g.155834 Transcript_53609/m.155834 type:complete len:655 (+) Transcript_53609:3-1967(+)